LENFYAFMIGKLLGDGTIVKQTSRSPRFSMLHRMEDKAYLEACHNYLSKYIQLSPILYKKTNNSKVKNGYSECYYCYSKKTEVIKELYHLWYPKQIKILPKALIENYFNTQSLAVWYQDDGHLKVENNKARKIVMSTECFSNSEIYFLQYTISSKFDIHFRIDKQRRLILYNVKEIMYFLFLVRPFLYPGMKRKDITFSNTKVTPKKKRTSLSLPAPMIIAKPTSYLNEILGHTLQIRNSIIKKEFYTSYYPLLAHNQTMYENYQIEVNAQSLSNMDDIKRRTGLTYNEITYLCLLIENKKIAQGD
jgi:LAGLIDADG DNA endonuclease family